MNSGERKGAETVMSVHTLRRMPQYYNYLKLLRDSGAERVSATVIAKEMKLNDVQVRKDLAAVSENGGTPRTGFGVTELLRDIGHCLGYDNVRDAALVGVGHMGSALLSYGRFEEYGVRIVVAFDNDEKRTGKEISGRPVYQISKLPDLCRRLNIRIGIITVPEAAAQSVCDLLVEGGIKAVWNFAPAHLTVPDDILVQNENMAVSLALLSQHLAERQ